ncbi:MAG: YigZ family protein [Thermoanaerobaculia bacterium]
MPHATRDDTFQAPISSGEAELREKGSRFLAIVAPAADEAAARAVVDRLTADHHDATHVCFAWRLGWPPAERMSDAGARSSSRG